MSNKIQILMPTPTAANVVVVAVSATLSLVVIRMLINAVFTQSPATNKNDSHDRHALRTSGDDSSPHSNTTRRRPSLIHSANSSSDALHTLTDNTNIISEDLDKQVTPETRNLLELLHSVATEQCRAEGYIHRGITCNMCHTSPIRGVRYKCANCVDFDICEVCESSEAHNKLHVFIKIRTPIPPLANPRTSLLTAFYPGKHTEKIHPVTWDEVRDLQRRTHFDLVEIQALFEQFKSLSTADTIQGGIDKHVFEQCLGPLGVDKNMITDRIFSFYDQDQDGWITFPELVCGLSVLCKGTLDEKITYSFQGYDLDNDGFISRGELRKMFKAYFYLSMELVRDVVRALEEEMMDQFDDEANKPVSASFTAPIPATSTRPEQRVAKHISNSSTSESDPSSSDQNVTMKNVEDNNASDVSDEQELQARIRQEQDEEEQYWPAVEVMSQDAIDEMVDKTFQNIDKQGSGMISLEEFRDFVQHDSTLIAWFEALGTVF